MSPAPETVPGRSCGTCTLCCRLPDIDVLEKPANVPCRHCIEAKGCSIYAERPSVCRDFHCRWMTSEMLGDEWAPARSHMMVYHQGPQITVLVDPAYPDIWRTEPYLSQLHAWASEAEACSQYVILFSDDQVIKIEPLPQQATAPNVAGGTGTRLGLLG
jgi:Fe-S-cluster containining protein